MAESPQARIEALINSAGRVEEAEIARIFDQLEPIEPQFLIGEWQGGSFDTGHPTHALLVQFKWAGKTFRSVDDVDPIVLYRAGERVPSEQFGHARIREVKFRGVVSAAMVYDKVPIIDSFRYVTENMVMGAMDSKLDNEHGTYFFYLTRLKSKL